MNLVVCGLKFTVEVEGIDDLDLPPAYYLETHHSTPGITAK